MSEGLKPMTVAEWEHCNHAHWHCETCNRIALALKQREDLRKQLWEIVQWIDDHATFPHFQESGWSEIGSRAAALLKGVG